MGRYLLSQSKEQALTPGIQEVWVDLRKRIGLCV